ncbi:MAG: hypothetical protein HYV17_08025 [Xanthomonadales bacterium]|nr:hypothetical protein [Xanthomonadales bacterium]
MSNKSSASGKANPSGSAGGGGGSAPSASASAASTATTTDITAEQRAAYAKAAKCKPEQIIGARDYGDRVVLVVQGEKTVAKVEIAPVKGETKP